MDTSPSAVAAREADLWSAAFDFSAEPLLLLDPMGIASSMGTGRPVRCLAMIARCCGNEDHRPAFRAGAGADRFHAGNHGQGLVLDHVAHPRHAAGNELRLEYSGSLIPQDGAPLVLLAMNDLEQRRRRMVDVTAEDHMRGGIAAWQRVERVFRDIERENQLILRAAGEGIYGVNAEGKTTFVNPVAERILGWSAEELVGTDIHSTVHHTHHDGRHYPHTDCPIYAAFRDGAVHQVNDEVFWRKDGTPVWVEYTSTPIRDRGCGRRGDRIPRRQPAPRG
jgi:PAS domain S-box-containing protein